MVTIKCSSVSVKPQLTARSEWAVDCLWARWGQDTVFPAGRLQARGRAGEEAELSDERENAR